MYARCVLLGALVVPLYVLGDEVRQDARVFRGENLNAVAMPVGGIGTGTVWVAGDGRLCVWQVFNNYDERPLPDTFLALHVAGETKQAHVLERADGWGAKGFPDVSAVGEYPFLVTRFKDPALPVAVELEAFSPMIPTNTKDSSLPCAIFCLKASNTGGKPIEASFLFGLQNPVGYVGGADLSGRFFSGYGANRNTYEKAPEGGLLHLKVASEKGSRFGRAVRLSVQGRGERAVLRCQGAQLVGLDQEGAPRPEALWLEGLTGGERGRIWQLLGAVASDGGVVLVSGAETSFWERLISLESGEKKTYEHEVFEDFEKDAYEGWKVEGAAFGKEPHTGTTPGQQPVSGFAGKRLVNTFLPDDVPHGKLTSRPFKITGRHIGFLIGGGDHPGRTCMNLLVDGKIVRTKTGKAAELLEPASWNVSEFRGKNGLLEVVDQESGPWGHINVDQIIFSEVSSELILAPPKGMEDLVGRIPVRLRSARVTPLRAELPSPVEGAAEPWKVKDATVLEVDGPTAGYQVLAESGGVPLIVSGPFGKGQVVVALGKGLPASWGMALIARALGTTYEHGEGIERTSPAWGDLTLGVVGDEPSTCARWNEAAELWGELSRTGRLSGPSDSGESPAGETYNGALAVPFKLDPGASKTVKFILTWYFPNVERFGHQGNKYADWFRDARDVDKYVRENFERLVSETRLFHDTVYASNLPYYVLDAFTSQLAILRGPTCWWAQVHRDTKKDYFAGYEGCYDCCPLNCTHVWNYAQTHARLFPEIGRNLRWYDFMHYLKETGETQHRQHAPHEAFIDGHCAVIEGAYREYLMSPDDSFLKTIYPKVKLAVEWLIKRIDPDEDGVNGGEQWNTYDVATDGAHTFIGSQYLSALAAGEKMALVMGDGASAARWRKILGAGSVNQDKKLWNGEYWIQVPDPKPARDYDTGCHSDQLLGQWWAHMLDVGYLYPRERVKTALRSIYAFNFRKNFRGFQQLPRRYVLDDEAGLLICTWPKGGRPDPFILYADEVWTGIEYELAGLMIWEGLLDEGLSIVKAVRARHDGRLRTGLNSGPGGNPFNELECGKFYARALSSGGLLLACQGFLYEGPKAILGFTPRWKPEDHSSFFCAAEGWGLFTQKREGGVQRDVIECRWGKIPLKELLFAPPAGWKLQVGKAPRARLDEQLLPADVSVDEGGDGRIKLKLTPVVLERGRRILVEIPL